MPPVSRRRRRRRNAQLADEPPPAASAPPMSFGSGKLLSLLDMLTGILVVEEFVLLMIFYREPVTTLYQN